MRKEPWIAVVLCLSILASPAQASETIPVPVGTPPIMDGTLSSGEWNDALPLALSADFTLFPASRRTPMPMTDAELYEGLSQETVDRYKREAREQYDSALVEASEKRARKMSKEAWAALKAEGEEVNRSLASMISLNPEDADVQAMIARHHATIEPFYHATAELYRGLGSLYVENPEFRAYYEKYALGLSEFMQRAMIVYADHVLLPKEAA